MFTKRNSDSPSELMKVEFELLDCKMKTIVNKGEGGENYYTSRAGEIEIDWLLEEDGPISTDKGYVWHANMPLSFWQCKEIFEMSKTLPKKNVMELIFPLYDLGVDEQILFDVVWAYGRSRGLLTVAQKLFDGAEMGDPRAVKMYLDLMSLIPKESVDDDDVEDKLMRVEFNI